MSIDDLPDLATPKQVREALQLSDYQLRTLIREGRIGHVPWLVVWSASTVSPRASEVPENNMPLRRDISHETSVDLDSPTVRFPMTDGRGKLV